MAYAAKQDPEVRSLLLRPERYRGSPGAVPNLCVLGKETGFRCLSRSLAASPPLRPAPPPFAAQGHSTRHFWKVSLKARGHGHDRNGAQPVQPGGNRTQREAGGPPRMRGVRCWSTDSGSPAQPSVGLGSQRCTCRSSRESGGEAEGREVQGQDSGCWCGHWTVAGTRVPVDTGRDSRACKYQFQVQHPQPPRATRIFPAGGFPGRKGTGSQVFLERGEELLSSQPRKALPAAASGLYRSGQPQWPFQSVLGSKVAALKMRWPVMATVGQLSGYA